MTFIQIAAALVLSPLLFGVVNRTKAFFAGRQGPPLRQPYLDLVKLMRKGAVHSRTTTQVFRLAPCISLAAMLVALALAPSGQLPALLAFPGDLLLFVYLFGLLRFFTVVGALDTGSSFEGMGASRDVTFSAFAEIALFLGFCALARISGKFSLTEIYGSLSGQSWHSGAAAFMLILAAFILVFLTENARLPVDDPCTHLELTMIHEVMVLDYGGPEFGLIEYASALKFWLLGTLVVGLCVVWEGLPPWLYYLLFVGGMLVLAVVVGMVESCMARLRLVRIPMLLVAAGTFAMLALLLVLR